MTEVTLAKMSTGFSHSSTRNGLTACLSQLVAVQANAYNTPDTLPNMENLLKVKEYADSKIDLLTEKLEVEPSYVTWRALAETVLARIVVFNKHRASEPAKLLLSAFVNWPNWQETTSRELLSTLKPMEQMLIQVPGNRNCCVPILITPNVGKAMDLLVKTCNDCGVSSRMPISSLQLPVTGTSIAGSYCRTLHASSSLT